MLPEITSQQQQIDIHISRTKQLMADRATLDSRRAFLDHLQQRISLVPVLADISDRMPENVLLTQFSRSPELLGKEEEAQTGASAADLKGARPNTPIEVSRGHVPDSTLLSSQPPFVTIRGVARAVPDILEFAAALERSKLLDRVEMQIGQPGTWAGKQVQQFEVTCALVPQTRSRK
jgi:Tfp pilus assembly protein PilN